MLEKKAHNWRNHSPSPNNYYVNKIEVIFYTHIEKKDYLVGSFLLELFESRSCSTLFFHPQYNIKSATQRRSLYTHAMIILELDIVFQVTTNNIIIVVKNQSVATAPILFLS